MSDGVLVGFLLGLAAGLLLGPVLRWWLAAREWRQASEEVRLTDEVLRRMVEDSPPPRDHAKR
jgi:hypothetical protein